MPAVPFPTLPFPSLPPYGANNSPLNVALAAGLDIQANVPVDGRSLVWTDAQRKNIRYAYEGLEVRVLATGRKFKFERRDHPAGAAANNDAWWSDITESVPVNGYKGPWNPVDAFPGLVLVNPLPGDYYIVSEGNTGSIGAGPLAFDLGDLVIYAAGIGWHRIANYSPTLPVSIAYSDVVGFDERVFYNIARGGLRLHNPAQSYLQGQMVAVIEDYRPNGAPALPTGITAEALEQAQVYGQAPGRSAGTPLVASQEANQTRLVCSIYWALRDTAPNEALGNTQAFLLISTTNYNRLYGRLLLDNTAGFGGSNASADDGAGKVADIKEIMRRVQLLVSTGVGQASGPVYGGAPDTPDSVLGVPVS